MLFSTVFKLDGKKVTFTFSSYEATEEFITKVQKEFPNLLFYLYNRSKPTPAPKQFSQVTGTLWCPYCADRRKFIKSSFNPKYKVCEICGISDAEYHVRRFNQLWESIIFTADGEIQLRKGGKTRKIGTKKGAVKK